MPAIDQCHPHVVRALVKAGWVVLRDPFRLVINRRNIFIDLEISNLENDQQILLIEVKCFPDRTSTTRDLYAAFGQYLVYRAMLEQAANAALLYLSIPVDVFETIFDPTILKAVEDNEIKLLVVDLEHEVIIQWIR